jgi:hypothetical protein
MPGNAKARRWACAGLTEMSLFDGTDGEEIGPKYCRRKLNLRAASSQRRPPPSGLVLRGSSLHEKGNRFWVGFPGRPDTAPDGTQSWANIIDCSGKDRREKFQQMALAAALQAYEQEGRKKARA